ncbi:MAG: IPT/TIG domain-containing protein [Actinobacteria bacterium]|nr:IPT/TIG domain-containing protein [Actinomycetota bacterium]
MQLRKPVIRLFLTIAATVTLLSACIIIPFGEETEASILIPEKLQPLSSFPYPQDEGGASIEISNLVYLNSNLVTMDSNGNIFTFDANNGQLLDKVASEISGNISGLTTDHQSLYANINYEKEIYKLDVDTGSILQTIEFEENTFDFIRSMTYLDGYIYAAVASQVYGNPSIISIDPSTGIWQESFNAEHLLGEMIDTFILSSDGNNLVLGTRNSHAPHDPYFESRIHILSTGGDILAYFTCVFQEGEGPVPPAIAADQDTLFIPDWYTRQVYIYRSTLYTSVIEAIAPDNGYTGDEITITGKGFGQNRESSIVSFAGVDASEYLSWSDTEIRTRVPIGSASGPVSVRNSDGFSNRIQFTLYAPGEYWGERDEFTYVRAVSAIDTNNVWAVSSPDLLFYDGTKWNRQLEVEEGPQDIFILDENHMWVVGCNGLILFYDGNSWIYQDSGINESLGSVYALDENHVWVAGAYGTILFFDGTSWSMQDSGAGHDYLWGIYAADSSNVWAVGDSGNIYFYDGTSWISQDIGIRFRGIKGLDKDHIWAVGNYGIIYFYDGLSWAMQDSGTTNALYSVYPLDTSHVWAVGSNETILFSDGISWSSQACGDTCAKESLLDVYALDLNNVWAVGEGGEILFWDGASWLLQESDFVNNLGGITAADESNVWAVSPHGEILYCGATSYVSQTSGVQGHLYSISSASTEEVWAVGENGSILYFDGMSWDQQSSGTDKRLFAVFALDENHVWAAGSYGVILFYDGETWMPQPSGTSERIYDLYAFDSSHVWAVGCNGTILFFDGNSWIQQVSGVSTSLYGVTAYGPDGVWAVGGDARPLFFNGSSWCLFDRVVSQSLYGVTAVDENHVWVAGGRGELWFFDGSSWAPQESATSEWLYGITAIDRNHIYVVGDTGMYAYKDICEPKISNISPQVGYAGTEITISGSSFGENQNSSYINFTGTLISDCITWSDSEIRLTVPGGSSSGFVRVITPFGESNNEYFEITASYIDSISPNYGIISDEVTINGSNFGDTKDDSIVVFSEVEALNYLSWSDNEIVVEVPPGATSGEVKVITVEGGSNGVAFTVLVHIDSITPEQGAVGAEVTITGSSFGSSQEDSVVNFSGVDATDYISWDDGQIEVLVPEDAASGEVKVITSEEESNGVQFHVLLFPIIDMDWEQYGPYSLMINSRTSFGDTLAISPADSNIVYYNHAGSFYKSENCGSSWEMINRQDAEDIIDYSLVADVLNPQKVFAVFRNRNYKGELHVSVDGGTSWSNLGGSFFDIAQSDQDASLLYAVDSENILQKSEDGGLTWQPTSVNAAVASPPSGFYQRSAKVIVCPSDDQCVYTSYEWDYFVPEPDWDWLTYGMIVKTEDGGATSEVVYEGRANLWLAVSPDDSDMVYASSPNGKCLRTADGGDTWIAIDTGYPAEASGPVVIDPLDADTVYLFTCSDLFFPFGNPDWESYLLKSTDGGGSWFEIETGLPSSSFEFGLWVDPNNPNNLYAQEIISGLYKTSDEGMNWSSACEGINISVNLITCDPQSSEVFSACGDIALDATIGGAFRSYNNAGSWESITNLGFYNPVLSEILIDQEDPDYIYAASVTGGPFEAGVWISDDGGVNWGLAESPVGTPWAEGTGFGLGVTAMANTPDEPSTIYALKRGRDGDGYPMTQVCRSVDKGETWEYRGSVQMSWYDRDYIAIDAASIDTIYIASGNFDRDYHGSTPVYKSTDGGSTWQALAIPYNVFSCLVTHPSTPGLVYIGGRAMDGYANPINKPALYRSDDSGETGEMFIPDIVVPGFDSPVVKCMCLNPDNSEQVYAVVGQYSRFDSGPATLLMFDATEEVWYELETTSIPDAQALDMACSRDYLYLATNNGVFRSALTDYNKSFNASTQEDQTLTTEAGDAITVPPGALSEDVEVSLSILSSEDLPEPPGGVAKIARAFDFGPDGLTFQQPATVVFTYTEDELDGANEEDLQVYYYDSVTSSWQLIAGVIDTEQNTITCTIDHFTTFAIMAADTQPPEISITSPLDASEIMGIVDFSAQASDNVKLWKVEFYLDGNLLEADTAEPYVHSLDTGFIAPGVHTLTAIAHDTAGLTVSDSIQVRVKAEQETTTLALAKPQPVQYSDQSTIEATLLDEGGQPLEGKPIAFSLEGVEESIQTDATGIAVWAPQITLSEGSYTIDAVFEGDVGYLDSNGSTTIEVSKENASTIYNGDYLKQINDPVQLSAEVSEETDESYGEIVNAGTVTFQVYDSQGALIREVIAPVTEMEPGKGKAEITTDPLPTNVYTVKSILNQNGYYFALEDTSQLVIYDPEGGYTTGAGSYWEGWDRKSFGFDVHYSYYGPLAPNGYLTFTDWSCFWDPLYITATEFAWLVIPSDTDIAYVAGACKYDGQYGYTFNLVVEDDGCWWWSDDTFHITVKDSSNQIVYESQGEVSLGGILVHH